MKKLMSYSAVLVVIANGCGKKSKSENNTATENPIEKIKTTAKGEIDNALANAYPSGLNLSMLPSSAASSASLAETEVEPDQKPAKQVREAQKKMIEGKGDDCLPEILKTPPKRYKDSESCYEFDHDMVQTTITMAQGSKSYGTKNGKDSAGKQACLVSFAQSKIAEVSEIVERSTAMVQAMMCQAKKENADVKLPEVGAKLDLKAAVGKAMGSKGAKQIDSASIERLPDDSNMPVYLSEVVMVDPQGQKRTTKIVHSPKSTDAEVGGKEFSGTLWTIMDNGNNNPQDSSKKRVLSINYSRTVDGTENRMRYELKTANFHESLLDAALSDAGVVDFNAGSDASGIYSVNGAPVTNSNDAVSGSLYVAFDMNADNNTGNFSYWQNPGGNYNEAARGMVFNISKNATSGALEGCASTGAAVQGVGTGSVQPISIRKAIKEEKVADWLTPGGFYHPFINLDLGGQPQPTLSGPTVDADGTFYIKTSTMGQGQESRKWYIPAAATGDVASFATAQVGAILTKQCFIQSAAGSYDIDTSKTVSASGYDLIKTSDSAKLLMAPSLKGIKPLPKINP